MPAITRPQLAVYAAAAVAVLLLGARYLSTPSAAGGRAAGGTPGRAAPAKGASVRVEAAGSGADCLNQSLLYRLVEHKLCFAQRVMRFSNRNRKQAAARTEISFS